MPVSTVWGFVERQSLALLFYNREISCGFTGAVEIVVSVSILKRINVYECSLQFSIHCILHNMN